MNLYIALGFAVLFGGVVGWFAAIWAIAKDPTILMVDGSMAIVKKVDLERLQLIARVLKKNPDLRFDEKGFVKHTVGEEEAKDEN